LRRGGAGKRDYLGKEWEFPKGDAARKLHIIAAIQTITDDPVLFMVGTGSYGYWQIAGPNMDRLKAENNFPFYLEDLHYGVQFGGIKQELPRPPTLPIVIVEYGALGLFLIFAVILKIASIPIVRIQKARLRKMKTAMVRPMLLLAWLPFVSMGWAFFTSIQSVMLVYFIIMPNGIVDSWTKTWESWPGNR